MLNKILLALGVVVTISALGRALTCNNCGYTSKQPKAQQMCGNVTVDCTTGYCYTTNYTTADGTVNIARDCANRDPNDKDCPDGKETCERRTKAYGLKSCVASCCQTNSCNNDYIPARSTPASSTTTSSTPTTSTPTSSSSSTATSSTATRTTPTSSTPTSSTPTSSKPTSSASGIMATKFILCLMVLAGILFA